MASGAAAYNPATGLPSIIDANELTFASTTISGGNITAGASTIQVASTTGLSVDQYIQVDAQGSLAEILQITAIASPILSVFPSCGKNHNNGVPVVAKVVRQVMTQGDGTNAAYLAKVLSNGAQVQTPASGRTIIAAGTTASTTNVRSTSGVLVGFWNTGPALSVYLQLYDSAAGGTQLQSNCIWGDGTAATALGAGQIVTLNCFLTAGLTYTLSGTLPSTNNIVLLTA